MVVANPWASMRSVGGQLIDEIVATSESSRIEIIRRDTAGVMFWEFEQPTLVLLWLRSGFKRANLRIDGRPVDVPISRRASLGLIASNSNVRGEFETGPEAAYSLAFLDAGYRSTERFDMSTVTFADRQIMAGFAEVSRESVRADPLFPLLLEGWSLETLFRLGKLSPSRLDTEHSHAMLTPSCFGRVREFIEESYAQTLTVTALAEIAGYSTRHFARAFRNTCGQTPIEFITDLRIERAKGLIRRGELSFTEIALVCGFGQSQRFSTVFKQRTGSTPSEFGSAE